MQERGPDSPGRALWSHRRAAPRGLVEPSESKEGVCTRKGVVAVMGNCFHKGGMLNK